MTSDVVETALSRWPATRNSDRKLIIAVWWLQDRSYQDDFKTFFLNKAIMPETITRCRRKLQEAGKYVASQQTNEDRYAKFSDMRGSSGDLSIINNRF